MTPIRLALVNLFHDWKRTAVSVTGAAFAVVLVFMQLGFLGSVENTATLFYDTLQYDVMILSSEYIDMSRPGSIDRVRLAQARSVSGVSDVHALSLGGGLWRNPTDDPEKGKRKWQISIVGIDPASMTKIFRRPHDGGIFTDAQEEARQQATLSRFGAVLLDEMSRPDFGDPTLMPPGTKAEFNDQSVELAGYFRAGTGFSYTGLLITNEETFHATVGTPSGKATLGLVSIEPGRDADEVAENMRRILPPDTRIFTRSQMGAFEREYWVTRTAVGQFFYFGVLLALTVGSIFIYQMMVADIKKHLPEYATLKAMGYRFGYLFRLVSAQAIVLAVLGYAIGLAGSLGLYEVTKAAARLPIWMTYERMVVVLVLTVLMCVGSGLVAVRKVKNADPASLF
jgi:putative ABC transport system permease protein